MFGKIFFVLSVFSACFFMYSDGACYSAILSNGTYLCPTGLTLNSTQCCGSTVLTDCSAALLVNGSYVCPSNLVLQGSQCCNSTTTTTTNTTCVDLKNSRTGVSDCPSRAFLCNNALYYSLMTQQCPKTCGRCSTSTSTTTAASTTCADLTNPITGISDCPTLSYLCNSTVYSTLMKTQCRLTCGYCTSG